MKTMHKTLIILIIGIVLIICGLSLGGYQQLKETDAGKWISKYDWDSIPIADSSKEIDKDEIENLKLEIESAKVTIKEEKRDNILVQVKDAESYFDYDVDDNCLKIEQTHKVINSDDAKINIIVPKGFQFDEVTAETGVGKLTVSSINAKKIDLEVGAGQIIAKNINCEDELNIDCGLGDVSVTLYSLSQFGYSIDCGMGNVTIGDDHYSGIAQSKSSHEHQKHMIYVSCGMGNVDIKEE